MAYMSDLLGKPVVDIDSKKVGVLEDVIAAVRGEMAHPVVEAILVHGRNQNFSIPIHDVAALVSPSIPLNKPQKNVVPYQGNDDDLFLNRDVLDKQIIDTDGVRVVRVNDLELANVDNRYYIANVDIGFPGLLRRTGLSGIADVLSGHSSKGQKTGKISWDHVELLPGDQPMRLKVSSEKISELHPADLAEIISDLTRPRSGQLLDSLDVETLADTLEEVEPDLQASLVESMPDEKVADLLEEMAPDEAADLLAEMPKDRSTELLNMMEQDEAKDVRKLLTYPEESAGGIMTTEFVTLTPGLTAGEAINTLREAATTAETVFYIYITEKDGKLAGVLSLSDLVLAKPETPISAFMHKRIVSVDINSSQDEVAHMISKYNLLAVPVVDELDRIQGIVTADDALDKIIPTAWKKRLPRFFR